MVTPVVTCSMVSGYYAVSSDVAWGPDRTI